MGYVPKTKGGYLLGEVISALQKEIRRGNEEEAMYWALELCPDYEKYLWRRLLIIAHEDIGIANLPLHAALPHWRALYLELRLEGKADAILMIANAILGMCRSPKCRLADTFQGVVMGTRADEYAAYQAAKKAGAELPPRHPTPDYAIDRHTGRGRSLGRGLEHWLAEGCRLNPLGIDDAEYRERALEAWRKHGMTGADWPKMKPLKGRAAPAETEAQQSLIDA